MPPVVPPKQLTQDIVLQWVTLAEGTFQTKTIWQELGIKSTPAKSALRVYLSRLAKAGVIAKTGVDGTYRKIDTDLKAMDWQSADPTASLPLRLPFNIHEYARIYPKSVIILAGSKNEGKTAFLLQCVLMNMTTFQVDLYNSETGPEQLKSRLEPLCVPTPAPFKVYERYDNFADVIDPTHLSIIDYLDMDSEVYMVGAEINKIHQKLTTGCAIIGLQKPPPSKVIIKGKESWIDRDLAYGGGFTAKRAVLYISLSLRRCKLVYVKTPLNPRELPANMTWSYSFDDNGYFTNLQRYHEPEDHGNQW